MRAFRRFQQIAFYLLIRINGESVPPPGSDFLVTDAFDKFIIDSGDEYITD